MNIAQLENRRIEAERLLAIGTRQCEVARLCRVSRTTASKWAARVKTAGGMAQRARPGRRKRLTLDQLRTLLPQKSVWTGVTFSREVERTFGVHYDPDHCTRILRELAPNRRMKYSGRPRATLAEKTGGQ